MNRVYLHSKDNLTKIVVFFLLTLTPLILYGMYKNGILLYQKSLISFIDIFKVLYLIGLGIIADFIRRIIWRKKWHLDLDFLSVFVVALFMPQKINLIVYFISILVFLMIATILKKWINFNKISFLILMCLLISNVFIDFNYMNTLETQNIYVFSFWDLLYGRNVGGIASTSIFFGIVYLIINTFFNNYKSNIAIFALISYILFSLLLGIDNYLINSSAIMAIILVAPESTSSPLENKERIIYGIIIGIVGAILTKYINYYWGLYLSVFLVSFLYSLFAKLVKRCYNRNDFSNFNKKLIKKEGN